MNTPWGKSESKQTIQPGLYAVQTAGHGGFMLTRSTAQRLTSRGREIGEWFGQYLCFEEDCDYAVLLFEMPDADWNTIFKEKHAPAEWKEIGRTTLMRYHPEYYLSNPALTEETPAMLLPVQMEQGPETSGDPLVKSGSLAMTIDISPCFTPEDAKRLDRAEENLHNAVRSVAEMFKELFGVLVSSPECRSLLERELDRYYSSQEPDIPTGHPGAGFLMECQLAMESWDQASDEFLAVLSLASPRSRNSEAPAAEQLEESEDLAGDLDGDDPGREELEGSLEEQWENNQFAHDDDPPIIAGWMSNNPLEG